MLAAALMICEEFYKCSPKQYELLLTRLNDQKPSGKTPAVIRVMDWKGFSK